MTRIDAAALLTAIERGERVFDTRSAAQRARDPVAGAEPLTLDDVQAGELPDVDRSAPIHLICAYGAVSDVVGAYLEAAGFSSVTSVSGGVVALRALTGATPDRDRR